jgi:hypothetical protein
VPAVRPRARSRPAISTSVVISVRIQTLVMKVKTRLMTVIALKSSCSIELAEREHHEQHRDQQRDEVHAGARLRTAAIASARVSGRASR